VAVVRIIVRRPEQPPQTTAAGEPFINAMLPSWDDLRVIDDNGYEVTAIGAIDIRIRPDEPITAIVKHINATVDINAIERQIWEAEKHGYLRGLARAREIVEECRAEHDDLGPRINWDLLQDAFGALLNPKKDEGT
jgi:hypothetical protein